MECFRDTDVPDVRLEVLIVTLGKEGLGRVLSMDAPRVEGVRYLLCCQNPDGEDIADGISELEARGDFRVHVFQDRGSARNRNHAFDCAEAEYLLIADDDLRFHGDALRKVIEIFDRNPDLDIATFRSKTVPCEKRVFADYEHDLSDPPRFYYTAMFEIALRRSSIEREGLRFSTLTGVGAPRLCAAEEDLLLLHASRRGLRGRYFPIEIVENTRPTTTIHSATRPAFLRSKGTYMLLAKGYFGALLRAPLEAWRSKAFFFKALYYYLDGCVYAVRNRKDL